MTVFGFLGFTFVVEFHVNSKTFGLLSFVWEFIRKWNGMIIGKWKGMELNGMYLSKRKEWKRME